MQRRPLPKDAIQVGGIPIADCETIASRITLAIAYGIRRIRRRFATQRGSIGKVVKRWKVVAPRKGSVASTRVGAQGMMSTRIALEMSTDIVEQ